MTAPMATLATPRCGHVPQPGNAMPAQRLSICDPVRLPAEPPVPAGWSRVTDWLPNGMPRTLISDHDAGRQQQMLALNIGRH